MWTFTAKLRATNGLADPAAALCPSEHTRWRPRPAVSSLTTGCSLVPVNSAHPDALLTSLARHVHLVDVRASDGYAATIAPLPATAGQSTAQCSRQ